MKDTIEISYLWDFFGGFMGKESQNWKDTNHKAFGLEILLRRHEIGLIEKERARMESMHAFGRSSLAIFDNGIIWNAQIS